MHLISDLCPFLLNKIFCFLKILISVLKLIFSILYHFVQFITENILTEKKSRICLVMFHHIVSVLVLETLSLQQAFSD